MQVPAEVSMVACPCDFRRPTRQKSKPFYIVSEDDLTETESVHTSSTVCTPSTELVLSDKTTPRKSSRTGATSQTTRASKRHHPSDSETETEEFPKSRTRRNSARSDTSSKGNKRSSPGSSNQTVSKKSRNGERSKLNPRTEKIQTVKVP